MEHVTVSLSLVAGTAGMYAVAWSPSRRDWLILRIDRGPEDGPEWRFVESNPTEDGARKIAYALYARDLALGACR
jgi:hypothetical protein